MYITSVIVSQSGLTRAVQDSKITLEQAEYEFLSFVRQHTPPGQCPLAGELLFSTSSRNVVLLNWFGSYSHVLLFFYLQVTLCMRTRGSWTSTCHSLCTTFTTESLMLAPSRSFAGQCLCDCGVSESLCAVMETFSALTFIAMSPCSVSALVQMRLYQ